MTAVVTYLAIAMIAIGFGIASHAIPSIMLWFWTLTRPTTTPTYSWAKPGQYYRGEMSPALNVSSTEGDGTWKHEVIAPHETVWHRDDVLRGIRIDTKQIIFSLALFASGVYLAYAWATIPNVGMSLLLAIPSFLAATYISSLVWQADPEYWEKNFGYGLARGLTCMSLFGIGVLVVVHILRLPEVVHFLASAVS